MEASTLTLEAKAAALITDEFLLRGRHRCSGVPGGPEADALLADIARKDLKL